MSVYDALTNAGCKVDHHESDLYVLATKEARTIIAAYPTDCQNQSSFVSETDGKRWIEIPFAYDPFWPKTGA